MCVSVGLLPACCSATACGELPKRAVRLALHASPAEIKNPQPKISEAKMYWPNDYPACFFAELLFGACLWRAASPAEPVMN